METIRLKHFKTIVDAGGLMKASQLLGITGGGLSKSIKVLEDELGEKLFFHKGRNLKLTEFGLKFYEKVPIALEVLADLVNTKSVKMQLEDKALRFCSFEVFTTYFLADYIFSSLKDRKIELNEAIPGQMEKLVFEGKSDIGITYTPIPYKGVEFLKTGKIEMSAFSSKPSKWKNMEVGKIPFIVPISPIEGSPSGVKGLDGWPEHLFERNTQYKVGMMETAIQLASLGMGVVFLPKFVASLFNEQVKSSRKLEEIEIQNIEKIYRDVYLIIRKNDDETKITKKLASAIRQLK